MISTSNKTSAILGAALVSAAMTLTSVQFACAEAPHDQGIVSFKYLHYQESQIGNGVDVITGASSAGSSSRMKVNAYSVMAVAPVAGDWSIGLTSTSDSVSGASPTYHSSGLTKMTDLRRSINVDVTRYFSSGTLSFGTGYSGESDYISRSFSLQGSLSTEDKNTTVTLGGSINADDVRPVTLPLMDYPKKVYAGMLGVTRILSKNDIAQLDIGYSNGNGDFSDPYKLNDNRPDGRDNTTVLARWNHHLSFTDGTARLSYRYYSDTFGIKAHTLNAEYVQPLPYGLTATPLLRLYSQNAAYFYVPVGSQEKADPTKPTPPPAGSFYSTEDQRLSAFGAITLGLKVSMQLGPDWAADINYEEYEQRGKWSINGTGDSGLAPFGARSIQLGLSRKF